MFGKVKRYIYRLTHPVIGEVWELHSVTNVFSENMSNRQYEISPEYLEKLIMDYKRNGYEFVSVGEVAQRLKHGKLIEKLRDIRHKFVAITLDDGFRDNYEVAYPIFKKNNVPFCIYITSGFVEGIVFPHNDAMYKVLTLEQIKELASDELCTIGAHSVHHVDLVKLLKEQMIEEISLCKQKIETWTEKIVVDFSSPYGTYNDTSISLLKELGFQSHVASWGGGTRMGSSIWSIPRRIIVEERIK